MLFSGSVSQVSELYAHHFIFVHPAILQVSGCSGILLLSRLGNIIDWEEFKDYSSDCSHAKHFQFPWQTCLLLALIKPTATKEPTPRKSKICPVCGIKPGTWQPGPSSHSQLLAATASKDFSNYVVQHQASTGPRNIFLKTAVKRSSGDSGNFETNLIFTRS